MLLYLPGWRSPFIVLLVVFVAALVGSTARPAHALDPAFIDERTGCRIALPKNIRRGRGASHGTNWAGPGMNIDTLRFDGTRTLQALYDALRNISGRTLDIARTQLSEDHATIVGRDRDGSPVHVSLWRRGQDIRGISIVIPMTRYSRRNRGSLAALKAEILASFEPFPEFAASEPIATAPSTPEAAPIGSSNDPTPTDTPVARDTPPSPPPPGSCAPASRLVCAGIAIAVALVHGFAAGAAAAESVTAPSPKAASPPACHASPLTVAVDVGHGPRAYGATSARGQREYDFNLRFANELVVAARDHPAISAFLLAPDEAEPTLRRRVELANEAMPDLFVSIHHDSAQRALLTAWTHAGRKRLKSDTIAGFSIFVSKENPRQKLAVDYAREIARGWLNAGHSRTLHHAANLKGERRRLIDTELGIYEAPFAVIKRTRMPALLIEVGVLINPAEEAWLDEAANRHRLQVSLLESLSERACATATGEAAEN